MRVGATGAGVPSPSQAKRAKASRTTTRPAAIRRRPAQRRAATPSTGGSGPQRVISQGIRPATTPGARTRKTRLPTAALIRPAISLPRSSPSSIHDWVRPDPARMMDRRAGHGCNRGSFVGSAYMRGQPSIDGSGAQLVVPRFVAVDLAEPVPGAVPGQPRRGVGPPDVDCVSRLVGGSAGHRHPSGGCLG